MKNCRSRLCTNPLGDHGRTECALVQRLRKHWTTTRSGSEDSPFYNMLLRTGIHHWTIAPLQKTACEITACFLERAWWFKWRKWALNASAPAIPSATDSTAPPPQHTKRLGTVLRRLHSARVDGDYAQIHFFAKRGLRNSLRTQHSIRTSTGCQGARPHRPATGCSECCCQGNG